MQVEDVGTHFPEHPAYGVVFVTMSIDVSGACDGKLDHLEGFLAEDILGATVRPGCRHGEDHLVPGRGDSAVTRSVTGDPSAVVDPKNAHGRDSGALRSSARQLDVMIDR